MMSSKQECNQDGVQKLVDYIIRELEKGKSPILSKNDIKDLQKNKDVIKTNKDNIHFIL